MYATPLWIAIPVGLSESKSLFASLRATAEPGVDLLNAVAPSSGWIATTQSPSTSSPETSFDCRPSLASQVSITFPLVSITWIPLPSVATNTFVPSLTICVIKSPVSTAESHLACPIE